jgi:nucleoside-diphosphate-sugar epimerase
MMSNELQGRRVTLIGGAGFIGHNLALALARQGAEVQVVDSLQVNNLLWLHSTKADLPNQHLYLAIINQRLDLLRQAGIPVIVQDARDYQVLTGLMTELRPQVVVHLAAVAHAGRSNKDPYSTFDHSLRTLENALDSSRGRLEHFIFLSSSMVYGDFLTPEVEEEHILNPKGIYGALKLAGEKLVIAYNQVFDLPYTIIRPSALYGPRCVSRRVGQIFIETALDGGQLRVDGNGEERLDFTYIDDLVDGLLLIIKNPKAKNQIFNMTYGQARKINDLVAIMKEYFSEVAIQYVERDRLMPFRGTMSVAKAKEQLGYNPKNPIEVGFPKYIDWYRDLAKDGGFWMDIKVNA